MFEGSRLWAFLLLTFVPQIKILGKSVPYIRAEPVACVCMSTFVPLCSDDQISLIGDGQ